MALASPQVAAAQSQAHAEAEAATERMAALAAAEKAAAASAREAELLRRRLEVKQSHGDELAHERDAAAAKVRELQEALAQRGETPDDVLREMLRARGCTKGRPRRAPRPRQHTVASCSS